MKKNLRGKYKLKPNERRDDFTQDRVVKFLNAIPAAKKNREGRILAVEKLSSSRRVKKMIREGKTHQIRSQLQVGGNDFVPFDISLADLYKQDLIGYEDGAHYADNEKLYQDLAGG